MQNYSIRECIELFHLIFLGQLSRKLDQNCYALKGGCNLKFYCKSIRYSEDIDFDVQIVNQTTLANKVRRLFESTQLAMALRAKDITLSGVSEPKQTLTTQRW